MAVTAMTMSYLPFNLHPGHQGGTRVRRSARLTLKGTRAPKKFDPMKCCARPARNGCSSETSRAIRSVTGKNIKNDALVRCESIHMNCVRSQIDNTYSPSSRVATAERKLMLVNDASAKSFSGTDVLCKHCDTTIALDGEGDYNLTKWQEHKAACPRSVRLNSFVTNVASQSSAFDSSPLHEPVAQETTTSVSDVSPSRSENRPPFSIASTEATAVDGAALSGGAKKRQREPDDDDSETRPRTRAKTDVERPSGALDWLLLPIRSFVSGFKKGMGQSTPTESMAT